MKPKPPKKVDPKPRAKSGKQRLIGAKIKISGCSGGIFDNYYKKLVDEYLKPKEGFEVLAFMKLSDVQNLVKGSLFIHAGLLVILESWEIHTEYTNEETTRVKLMFSR